MHVFQLKARELADDRRVYVDLLGDVGQRPSDVPRDFDGPSRGAKDLREQLGRRRLAVRAGDADQRVPVQEPVAELDLTPDRHTARACGRGERRGTRNPRALDHELDTVQQRFLLVPEHDFDARVGKPPGVGLGRAVDRDDLDPARGERERSRPPRAREPEHERPPRQPARGRTRLLQTCPGHEKRTPLRGRTGPCRERTQRSVTAVCRLSIGW